MSELSQRFTAADGTEQVEVWLDPVTGELVWQGAFIGRDALQTLTVEELSPHRAAVSYIADPLVLLLRFKPNHSGRPQASSARTLLFFGS